MDAEYNDKLDRLMDMVEAVNRRLDEYEARLGKQDRQRQPWQGYPIQRHIKRTFH